MNPKLSRKKRQLLLLENIENSLKNINFEQYPQTVIDNALFNIRRVQDLINHIL
jgi:hypothetical protein